MSGATPRVTRSRTNTPLPALPTRQSHAYGAQGKASVAQQVTTSAADMNAAFTSTMRAPRGPTRLASHETATPVPARRSRRPPAAAPVVEDEPAREVHASTFSALGRDETAESDYEARPGTSLQHSAAYISTSALAPRTASSTMPRPGRLPVPDASSVDEAEHEPWLATVFVHTLPRYVQRIYGEGWRRAILLTLTLLLVLLAMCATVFLSALLLTIIPIPKSWVPYRTDCLYRAAVLFRLPGYNQPPQELNERWQRWTHDQMFSELLPQVNMPEYQWAINAQLLGRIETTENSTGGLQQESAVQRAMIAELQSILPKTIVVEEVDGSWSIPPLFWKALVSKMESPAASPVWEHFLDSNQQRLRSYSEEVLAGRFEGMAKSHRLLTQDEFHAALTQHSQSVHEDLEQTIRRIRVSMLEEVRQTAHEMLDQSEIMVMARAQINALGHANYVYNINKQLHQINYFGVGQGAQVDPYYTSNTKQPPASTWGQQIYHYAGLAKQYPNPPAMALTGWEEATDAWCAKTSKDEKAMAQLTVKTAHKIYPTEVTIEHIPAAGTRDIASAPRDFEVWVQVNSTDEARRINNAIAGMIPQHTRDGPACRGKPPNGESTWVCLAGERYEIDYHNFIQSFTIWPDTVNLNIATDRIAIRVLSNWGAKDHTCLYQIRATGVEVDAAAPK